jgi:hypothetical protein
LLKISEPYLTKALVPFLDRIMNETAFPANVSADKLEAEHLKLLEKYCSNLIEIILSSATDFPVYGLSYFFLGCSSCLFVCFFPLPCSF